MFSRKKAEPAPPPIRRNKVIKAIQADMDFEQAMDRDVSDGEFEPVRKAREQATRGLSKAELTWVREARDRHGYGA